MNTARGSINSPDRLQCTFELIMSLPEFRAQGRYDTHIITMLLTPCNCYYFSQDIGGRENITIRSFMGITSVVCCGRYYGLTLNWTEGARLVSATMAKPEARTANDWNKPSMTRSPTDRFFNTGSPMSTARYEPGRQSTRRK